MHQISSILNGVKGQFDSVIAVINVSRNPHDIASVSFVLLDAEAQQSTMLFDSFVYANDVINQLSGYNPN